MKNTECSVSIASTDDGDSVSREMASDGGIAAERMLDESGVFDLV